MLSLLFFLVEVTYSCLLVNLPETVDDAGFVQDSFGKRGFPGSSVPEEYYVTNVICFSHCFRISQDFIVGDRRRPTPLSTRILLHIRHLLMIQRLEPEGKNICGFI